MVSAPDICYYLLIGQTAYTHIIIRQKESRIVYVYQYRGEISAKRSPVYAAAPFSENAQRAGQRLSAREQPARA